MQAAQSTDITALAQALLKVQGEIPQATKDAVNSYSKNRYASLRSIMDACLKPLNNNGILLTQSPCPAPDFLGEGYMGLMTQLTHAQSGQWMASLTVIPMVKSDPQGMGAAITYARRYALSAMLGIVACDDGEYETRSEARPNQPLSNMRGVKIEHAQAKDGRPCLVASGETAANTNALKQAGFKWNGEKKIWWKYE